MFEMLKNLLLLSAIVLCTLGTPADAEVIDKVVAFVDTEAITLSELRNTYEKTRELNPDVTELEVLHTMINRILLLREARNLRLEAADEDQLMNEYIDLKFRAFIKIKGSDVRDFFDTNRKEFGDASYEEVKDDIESYLLEKEVNYRIRQHLEDLRKKARIKVLL